MKSHRETLIKVLRSYEGLDCSCLPAGKDCDGNPMDAAECLACEVRRVARQKDDNEVKLEYMTQQRDELLQRIGGLEWRTKRLKAELERAGAGMIKPRAKLRAKTHNEKLTGRTGSATPEAL